MEKKVFSIFGIPWLYAVPMALEHILKELDADIYDPKSGVLEEATLDTYVEDTFVTINE